MKLSEDSHRNALGAKLKEQKADSRENMRAVTAECGDGGRSLQLVEGKVKVLIADDDRFVIEMLDFYLKKEGWDVVTAADGNEVEKMLEKGRYSILLLDVMMPFQTGFDVLKWLKNTSLMNSMRVVMLTAHDQDSTVRQAFDLGADDFISKPFNPELVVTRLKRFLPR
jgi:two-component system response regulator VicR